MDLIDIVLDPERDLVLRRTVALAPELVWRAWTEPELVTQWFAPKPWSTPRCEIDLRPGGIFRTVMRSPDGEEMDGAGCFLEVVPSRRLVWTDALGPGFRPNAEAFMTGVLLLEPAEGGGTHYTAITRHANAETRAQHAEMGFEQGWGAALDQLVALMSGG